MKVYAVDDMDWTGIYDPVEWNYDIDNPREGFNTTWGDFIMEISEEDLERYRKYEAETLCTGKLGLKMLKYMTGL